ncbi:hypothetical protein J6590_033901 [Homalodisca vitripennis]|nr:hypothetical protein J6590_033901 [Homalodisca vitripennis]
MEVHLDGNAEKRHGRSLWALNVKREPTSGAGGWVGAKTFRVKYAWSGVTKVHSTFSKPISPAVAVNRRLQERMRSKVADPSPYRRTTAQHTFTCRTVGLRFAFHNATVMLSENVTDKQTVSLRHLRL